MLISPEPLVQIGRFKLSMADAKAVYAERHVAAGEGYRPACQDEVTALHNAIQRADKASKGIPLKAPIRSPKLDEAVSRLEAMLAERLSSVSAQDGRRAA